MTEQQLVSAKFARQLCICERPSGLLKAAAGYATQSMVEHTEQRLATHSSTDAHTLALDVAPPCCVVLCRGAAQGEGLGNAFLSHISAVDGIYHVCRAFEDPDVTHVEDRVDPVQVWWWGVWGGGHQGEGEGHTARGGPLQQLPGGQQPHNSDNRLVSCAGKLALMSSIVVPSSQSAKWCKC
jgi:hypothetical protein